MSVSSHSSSATQPGKAPKQERGVQRVPALLEAAASLFAEKGVEAATMTEIAKRAGAPIGSLYQFFPSKSAVAMALLERYAARLEDSLGALRDAAPGLSPEALAAGLLAVLRAHEQDRALAPSLLEACADLVGQARPFRARSRALVEAVLLQARPQLAPGRAAAMTMPVLLMMKQVPKAGQDEEVVAELTRMLAMYLRAG